MAGVAEHPALFSRGIRSTTEFGRAADGMRPHRRRQRRPKAAPAPATVWWLDGPAAFLAHKHTGVAFLGVDDESAASARIVEAHTEPERVPPTTETRRSPRQSPARASPSASVARRGQPGGQGRRRRTHRARGLSSSRHVEGPARAVCSRQHAASRRRRSRETRFVGRRWGEWRCHFRYAQRARSARAAIDVIRRARTVRLKKTGFSWLFAHFLQTRFGPKGEPGRRKSIWS